MKAVGAVAVAGLAGQVSAALVGALSGPVVALTGTLYLLAVLAVSRVSGTTATVLRHVGSGLSLVAALAVATRLGGPLDPENVKGSLGTMLVAAQVGQVLSWRTTRDLRGGLVTALGLLVLGASYSPDILVGLPLVVGWVACLVALAQLQGARPVLPAAALAVVFGLVAFLLVPVPASASLRSRLAGAAPPTDRQDAGPRAYSGDEIDLNRRGTLSLDPVISVPAASPTLWRSTVFDAYDGRSWTRPTSTVLDGGPSYDVAPPSGAVRTDRVVLRGSSDGTIWAPGPLVSVTAVGSRIPLVDELGSVQLPGLRGGYTAVSGVLETNPALLRSTRGVDAPDARWRSLPVAVPPRVGQLARQITAGSGTRFDASEAIASWLRANLTYRLDSPVPEPGEDAVDRFLFVDRVGFCEQFASAEVVMLRSLGIPSRLVTGLAYGVPDGPGQRLYRMADLHAWVELWVPGVGWVTSDPTAGVPLAAGASHVPLRQQLSRAVTSGLRTLTSLPGGRLSLAGLLLALTFLVGAVLSRRPAPRARVGVAAAVGGGPALQAFLRFDARRAARRPAESLRELGLRLEPEVSRALQVVEQECYAPVAPDPRSAIEVLDRS